MVNAYNSFIATLYYLADYFEPNNYCGVYLSLPISIYRLFKGTKKDSLYYDIHPFDHSAGH